MKDNIIWVDFTAKNKRKTGFKKSINIIFNKIKTVFQPTSEQYNPKPTDRYHKSIL